MVMNIVPFSEKYLEPITAIFVREFSEVGKPWTIENAVNYLKLWYERFPEYSLAALDQDGALMGGIFCFILPYYDGLLLTIDVLLVNDQYRRQGVAKALMRQIRQIARENHIKYVQLQADERKEFPLSWYRRLGFYKNGWICLEAVLDDLKV